jgi:hypothetical protein
MFLGSVGWLREYDDDHGGDPRIDIAGERGAD